MKSIDFTKLSAKEIASGVVNKKWSAREVLLAHINRIKKYDAKLNSIITLSEDEAIADAKKIDELVAKGENPGSLAGVPFLVKDNFCTNEIKTTCASKMLSEWEPPYDATAVKNMKRAGAVLLGKTNMDEFSMGDSTETSAYGSTLNPRNMNFTPGGSSGGSAAAIAAGFVPIALGSDTGGSVRQPAAFCGVHGIKPSYGQISRYGIAGYVSSLDQVGVFSRNIYDMALLMDVLADTDVNDTTCGIFQRPSFVSSIKNEGILFGKKVAVLSGLEEDSVDKQILKAIDKTAQICEDEGAEILKVKLPISQKYAVVCYNIIAFAEASSKLACYDGMRYGYHEDGRNLSEMYEKTRSSGFGEEVKHRILVGTALLTRDYYEKYYISATKIRQLIANEYSDLFKKVNALISPVAPVIGYERARSEKNTNSNYNKDRFTCTASLAGLPAISLNIGFTEKDLPVNVQLVSSRYEDSFLISMASIIEKKLGSPDIVDFVFEGDKI